MTNKMAVQALEDAASESEASAKLYRAQEADNRATAEACASRAEEAERRAAACRAAAMKLSGHALHWEQSARQAKPQSATASRVSIA